MMLDLFGSDGSDGPQQIGPGAYLHHGVALPFAEELWREVQAIDPDYTRRAIKNVRSSAG